MAPAHRSPNDPPAPRSARGLSGALIGFLGATALSLVVLACATAWWAASGVFPWRAALLLIGAAWVINLGYGLRRAMGRPGGPASQRDQRGIP
ncbi:MAG: hypothetical protein AB7K52_09940 [Phycisphaerales bacterium]